MHPQTIIDYIRFLPKEQRRNLAQFVRGGYDEKPLAKYKDTEIWGYGREFDEEPLWYAIIYKGRKVFSSELFDELSNPDNYDWDVDSLAVEEEVSVIMSWFLDLYLYTEKIEQW
jgi:hypothetical protein